MQMFFSFNTRALENPWAARDNSAGWEELGEDDVREGTVLLSRYCADEDIAAASDSESDEDYEGEESDGEEDQEEDQAEEETEERTEEEQQESGDEEEEEEPQTEPVMQEGEERADEVGEEEKESEDDRLTSFIVAYVEQFDIKPGHKFSGWKRQTLQGALLNKKIKTMEQDVIKAINKYVKEIAAAKAAVPETE
jgi:hypothetical protein